MSKILIVDGYPVKEWGYEDGTHPNGYRLLKLYLLQKYRVCYHCGREVRDYVLAYREQPPPDLATIDHLIPRQFRKLYEKVEKVLSCYECNSRLNDLVQRRAMR